MEPVSVVTIREAATKLDRRREAVVLMVAREELTEAKINGRTAVLDDGAYRRMLRKATKVAA
jgi:hypothetical protein